jgi:hypothetical protein
MYTMTCALLTALLTASPASAQDGDADAPEFLLADLGVRIDLPNGWKMTKWADWEFKGETTAGDIFLVAWATPIQSPVTDPSVWSQAYLDKAVEMGGGDPEVTESAITQIAGRDVALIDVSLSFAEGKAKGNLYGGTFAAPGQMFHFALVTSDRRAKAAKKARGELLDRMEITQPPPTLEFAPTLSVDGISTTLPDGWRVPLKQEMAAFNKRVSKLEIQDTSHCFSAFKPKGLGAPDAMITCQLGLHLGVVDSYSFSGVDTVIQAKILGGKVDPAKQIDLEDRVGFVYDLTMGGLSAAVVPYDQGVARTWVVGGAEDTAIVDAAEAMVSNTTFTGLHPAGVGDQISYFLTYRPFSPFVLFPGLCCLAVVGVAGLGAGTLVMRRSGKDKYAALAEDD